MKGLFIMLGVLVLFAVFVLEMTKKPQEEINAIIAEQRMEAQMRLAGKNVRPKKERHLPDPWPPEMNTPYPNLILLDETGKEFLLHDYAGKVVVLEYIDMSSKQSQAQSGAALLGAYGNMTEVDRLVMTFADAFRKEVGEEMKYPNDNIVELKILVYTDDGSQPGVDDAEKWMDHFDLLGNDNVVVAVSKSDLRAQSTQNMIGGFQLLDRQSRLRVDSSGPAPKHNLRMTLVPLAQKLARN